MLGTGAAPQEAWLARRGIKTLPVRMRQRDADGFALVLENKNVFDEIVIA